MAVPEIDFNLKKPIVFFDIESTGLNVIKDRIVQLAMIKYLPGEEEPEILNEMFNPGVPLSQESIDVHGITPDMLVNKPLFKHEAQRIRAWIGDADLSGYNLVRFDIPMLMEEFHRAGVEFDIDNRSIIDVQKIFYKMEPRTLQAALRFYCEEELEGAHDALADVRATVDVLKGQMSYYDGKKHITADGEIIENPIVNDIEKLHDFSNDRRLLDVTQRLKYNSEGKIVFNFGKYIGKEVGPTLARDRQYYQWIQNKDFSIQVKRITKHLLEQELKKT